MITWSVGRVPREKLGGQLGLSLAGFLPVERRQLADLLVGRGGQALQHVFEVGVRFHTVAPAVFEQSVNDGAALAGFFGAEEQPVLFADGGGPDGIFHQVIVDLHLAVVQEPFQGRPLVQGLADGLAHRALRQGAKTQQVEGAMTAFHDHAAVAAAMGLAQGRSCPAQAQLSFPAIHLSDLV